jgi:hypothetical protein
MFSFNLFSRPRRSVPVRSSRLCVERLEFRDTPNAVPVITDFDASETMAGLYMFSGQVVDENPANLTIYFGGSPVSMPGQTTVTESDGWFSFVIQLHTDGSDAGTVTAYTVDDAGQQSNLVMVDVAPTNF